MKDNRAIINAIPVEIAQGDETCKYATFLISVLDEYDRMGRMIPKESGEQYHETLRGFPIVAKLIKDRANRAIDFGAHEMRQWTKRNGEKEVTFDTYPIGSVVDTWIESREVAGYEGEKSCIMAKAKLWTCRSPEYFKVLDRLWQENKVSSSWELITTDVEEASLGRKILRAFSFIGNALLGTTSVPAVRGAGIYEYAEAEEQTCQTTEELNEALLKDINEEQEELSLENEIIKENEPVENTAIGASENTDGVDAVKTDTESTSVPENTEEASTEATTTEGEEVSTDANVEASATETADNTVDSVAEATTTGGDVDARIAELQNALLSANEVNNRLQEDVARLQAELEALAPIKAEYEKLEAEKAEAERQRQIAELRQYALNTGKVTEAELADEGGDENIRSLIANLDRAGLNSLIVQRVTESFTSAKPVAKTLFEYNTASTVSGTISNVRTNITDSSDKKTESGNSLADRGECFVHAFINK